VSKAFNPFTIFEDFDDFGGVAFDHGIWRDIDIPDYRACSDYGILTDVAIVEKGIGADEGTLIYPNLF